MNVERPQGERRAFRSHYWPRTLAGRVCVALFLILFALTQPPFVYLANRIEPWILGVPFLYAYLLFLYLALIGVLIAARQRGL